MSLDLGARKFLISARAGMRLTVEPAANIAADLVELENGILPEDRGYRLQISTDLPGGRDSEVEVLLGDSMQVLQTEKVGGPGDPVWKLRRYSDEGFESWRAAPANRRERKIDRERWTNRDHAVEPFETEAASVVVDSHVLIVLAALAARDGAMSATVISSGKLIEVELVPDGFAQVKVDLELTEGDSGRRVDGKRKSARIRVRAHVSDGESDSGEDVDLGFLGMKGDLEVFVDSELGIPVLLLGRADTIGKLEVKAKKAELCR